jgi:mono/diheme cytochrome c family protein
MKKLSVVAGSVVMALSAACVLAAGEIKPAGKADAKQVERGRYLAIIGGCNDCHTAGFAPRGGDVPEREWLTGDGTLGWRGPWGTTYPTNLRLNLSKMTEAQWVGYAKAFKARPPMPWFNVNKWTESDLRAFYQYVRHLGPAGQPAPQALPPGAEPKTPVFAFQEPAKK